ncbi:hypothetical protein N9N75_01130 [Candidatus Pelagibacter sp.]|jgi:hypothetical protein|nr:hypothetical protein [Candidatus Pelagibacter sp.]
MIFIKFINNFFRQLRYSLYIFYIKIIINDISFNKFSKKKDSLKKLFDKYGSDKGNLNYKHNYSKFYSKLFDKIKFKKINLLEVGLGSVDPQINFHMKFMGSNYRPLASLFAWREYFTNGDIYGADIDKKILTSYHRINTFYVDMLNKNSIENMWSEINNKMDIIIDDGFHSFEANINLFKNSYDFLKKNGFYIIEDVHRKPNNIRKFYQFFKSKNIKFKIIDLYHSGNVNDNCLILIEK